MTCHSCASLIEESLLIHGVITADVSFAEKKVEIVYNDSLVKNEMLKKKSKTPKKENLRQQF